MEKSFFHKEINKQSRKEMAFYIKNHFTYDRLSSWNHWKGYANNVKIYNLGLTKEQEHKAYEMLLDCEVDASEFWESICDSMEYFKDLTGQSMYFNGRSDGYIVTDIDVVDYEDLKTMSKTELQKITEILQKFDKFCDDLRSDLIYYLDNATIEEVEEAIIQTKKVLTI